MLKAVQDDIDELAKEINLNLLEKTRLKVLFTEIPYDDLQVIVVAYSCCDW